MTSTTISPLRVLRVYANGPAEMPMQEGSLRTSFYPFVIRQILHWRSKKPRRKSHAFVVFGSAEEASRASLHMKSQSVLFVGPIDGSVRPMFQSLAAQIESNDSQVDATSSSVNASMEMNISAETSNLPDAGNLESESAWIKSEMDDGDVIAPRTVPSPVGAASSAAVTGTSLTTRIAKSLESGTLAVQEEHPKDLSCDRSSEFQGFITQIENTGHRAALPLSEKDRKIEKLEGGIETLKYAVNDLEISFARLEARYARELESEREKSARLSRSLNGSNEELERIRGELRGAEKRALHQEIASSTEIKSLKEKFKAQDVRNSRELQTAREIARGLSYRLEETRAQLEQVSGVRDSHILLAEAEYAAFCRERERK